MVQANFGSTRSGRVLVFKAFVPLILLGVAIFVMPGGKHPVITSSPFVFLAFIYLFSAQLHFQQSSIKYRRFVSWRYLKCEKVAYAEASFFPGLGVIKLTNSVVPWQRIYFILENTSGFLIPGTQLDVLEHHSRQTERMRVDRNTKLSVIQCLMICCIGAVLTLVIETLIPAGPQNAGARTLPKWMITLHKFESALLNWPWNLLTLGILLATIFLLRFRKTALGLSFALGTFGAALTLKIFGLNYLK